MSKSKKGLKIFFLTRVGKKKNFRLISEIFLYLGSRGGNMERMGFRIVILSFCSYSGDFREKNFKEEK